MLIQDQNQDQDQGQDRRISVSSGLETKTTISMTTTLLHSNKMFILEIPTLTLADNDLPFRFSEDVSTT